MPSTSSKNTEKLDRLFNLAEENGIPIDDECPEELISMSVKLPTGKMIIGLSKKGNEAYPRLEQMAHEMGHCMTDAFYEGYSPFELREKHERSANEWAVREILPFSELCEAVKDGCRELWELSEYFNVSEDFVKKAIAIHEQNGNVVPREFYEEY